VEYPLLVIVFDLASEKVCGNREIHRVGTRVGGSVAMDAHNFRESLTDAIRFWEPLRIAYNIVLAVIVLIYFVRAYPASKADVSFDGILFLFFLAVLANVAYCAVYAVDIFAQASGYRDAWRKRRWVLFAIGLLFAGIITRFWSMGMFTSGTK
jgi:hypothetical protein